MSGFVGLSPSHDRTTLPCNSHSVLFQAPALRFPAATRCLSASAPQLLFSLVVPPAMAALALVRTLLSGLPLLLSEHHRCVCPRFRLLFTPASLRFLPPLPPHRRLFLWTESARNSQSLHLFRVLFICLLGEYPVVSERLGYSQWN